MVEVSEGYARNFLLPKKLAIVATTDAINTMNLKEKARKAEEARICLDFLATTTQLISRQQSSKPIKYITGLNILKWI